MVKCPRCGRDVDTLQIVTPDVVTKEVINSIDYGEEELVGEDGMEVCAECMDELTEN